ncbi:MAG: 30S ribosomal protein S17 [Brevinematales bacterium]|nr:30S ribosomal protein S17 [Brevinematales bacterium]
MEQKKPKTLIGKVISDKMEKTRVVVVERRQMHSHYGKQVLRALKVYAHDENNTSHVGDVVEVAFSRPLSKTKRWVVTKVIETRD